MVGQLKEDVAEWYQGLSAHMRIEAMCTLIDLSMPFEIRFLGSLIEHLGRKDFGSLRDAEAKANSFANANPDDKKKLLISLGEVTTGAMVNGTQYANPLMHPTNFSESPANRPSPTHSVEAKGRQTGSSSDTFHGNDHHNDHSLCNEPSSNNYDCAGPKGNSKGASSISNHIGCSSEEETESMCIVNDHKRRKLILYISVLAPTNHDGANLYYTVLSDIEDSPALAWLEELDKDAQEEVSLLYTLASRHPAFTFEQRMFLATVANRVNEIISSKYSRGNTNPQQTAQTHHASTNPPGTYPVYYNHAALPQVDPKYASYYFVAHPSMHIQQSPHQPSVSSNGEQIRNTTVTTPFPAYSFAPYFVSPHHPAALQHPTALNPQFAPIPIPSTASPVAAAGQNIQQSSAPVVACTNNPAVSSQGNSMPVAPTNNNNNHHLSSSKSQNSLQTPHVSPPSVSNSISQPSCLSTPSRTSSSVPFQSEANSVDGDSAEESSENCDWNSPESSPFESPPQSLTPSRSQSPPSAGVPNSTSVQSVSLSGHSSTFLVTSNGGTFVGPVVSSSSSSSSSTIVKTEIHTNTGLVITTATSSSSTSCSTTASNNNNSCVNVSGSNTICNNFSTNNNNSVNASKASSAPNVHHSHQQQQQPPLSQAAPHHPTISSTSVRGGGQMKNCSAGNNNSSQSFSNHPPPPSSVMSSTVISVSQQQQQQALPPQTLPQPMMGPSVPVHLQQTSVLTSVNNAGGIVSHSMSSANPPLHVAFAQQSHGAHNSLALNNSMPPPSQNSYPCFPHMNAAVSFGGMNAAAAYRAPSQNVLTRNPYVQPHNVAAAANALLTNQMVINKGNDVRVHGSLRQKTSIQQNTPKRRSNVAGGGGIVSMSGMVGPLQNNSQSTSGKGEVPESPKDNRTNEIVVSANPSSNKGAPPQQTDRTSGGGTSKPYHQQHVSNGLVNALSSTSSGAGGGVLPNNPLPNISANSNSVVTSIPPPQAAVAINSSANPGGQLMQSTTTKGGEDGLLGEGGVVLDSYPVNQLPYHMNGPQIFGHPTGPYIQLPNGYMPSFNYPSPSNMAAAVATMGGGGPPVPPSTEIMMNPAGVPHFSFPFTIPQSFASPPSTGSKGISNSKDSKSSSLHGSNGANSAGGGGGTNPVSNSGSGGDCSNKVIVSNQHENHGGPPPAYPVGYYTAVTRTPSQPRNNRGVILDIGGALGNSSLSPVNVDVAVMPPLDDLVDTLHRPRKISCYNCGASTHLGPDCKEGSMEEMTRHQFRVNYSGPSSVTADGKDGD